MPPLVSILVPVYNGCGYVGEALQSVQAQTYDHWEALVVDDGSTDGSGEVVRALATGDARIQVRRQENRGLPAARNTALEHARGKFVAFLDADDLWLPHKLERQVAAWSSGVLYSDALILEGEGPPRERIGEHIRFARGQILEALVAENVVPILTAFVPREMLAGTEAFDPSLRGGCEDYDLWLRLAANGVAFDYLDEPLAVYRMRDDAMSRNIVAMVTARLTVLERAAARATGELRGRFELRAEVEQRALAGALRQRAWRETLGGDLELAHSDLRAAHAAAPTALGRIGTAVATRNERVLRALARRRTSAPHRT